MYVIGGNTNLKGARWVKDAVIVAQNMLLAAYPFGRFTELGIVIITGNTTYGIM